MFGRQLFSRHERLINVSVAILRIIPIHLRQWLFVKCRNVYGTKGVAIRYVLLRTLAKQCGKNVVIKEMTVINNLNNLVLGDNVSIHSFCYIDAAGGIEIGSNVSIAHSSSILSANHTWNDNNIPIKYNPVVLKKVFIEDDVWIGCGCRVLAGVTIHSRSVVAAGAVVTKDIKSRVIVAGVPARVLKSMDISNY